MRCPSCAQGGRAAYCPGRRSYPSAMGRGRGGVDAVVFDMDGTLVESHGAVTAAYRAAVLAGGSAEPSDADIIAAYPLGPPAVILTHLLRHPATDQDLERYHVELAARPVAVYDGIDEVLSVAAGHVALGLFTGASHQAAQIVLHRAGLLGHFRTVVGGDEVTAVKPDPAGIYLACQRLGVDPRRTAYVGDSPLDLEAARRSGAVAVAAAWGHQYDPNTPAHRTARYPRDVLALIAPPGSA
jgi:HAD superfamily hydrolase (TIGR01549 family)